MDVVFVIFAVLALIVGAAECFVGYKSVKELSPLAGYIAGASLGTLIGIFTDSILYGIIFFFVFGFITAVISYFLKSAGIILISGICTVVSVTLIFGNITAGVITGLVIVMFTMFFYKTGSVISTSFLGSAVIVYSAFYLVKFTIEGDILFFCILIWILIDLVGVICQLLTTMYDNFDNRSIIDTISNYFGYDAVLERKYPGFQRAYRNYCIKCGFEVSDLNGKCPRCGFDFSV